MPPQPRPPPRPQLTHFLCIPLATPMGRPQLSESLAAFHADLENQTFSINEGGSGGPSHTGTARRGPLPDGVLKHVGTLHLTLGVLSLPNGTGPAVETLQKLAGAAGDRGVTVGLRGLHAMQPPSRASVLYAPPVDEATGVVSGGDLLSLCQKVRTVFKDLIVDEGRPLLLHATLLHMGQARRGNNTGSAGGSRGSGRGGRGGRGGGRGGGRLTFDARDLVERYDDNVWMEHVPVHEVALCRMGAVDEVDKHGIVVDAAYPVVASVQV